MKSKHSIGMRLIETPAIFIMVLFVCVVSVPAIMYIGLKHLKYKIKIR
jgi:hypothetical protein